MLLYRVRSFETAILFQFLKIPEAWLVITFQIAQLDPYCGNEIFTWFSFFWLFLPHSLIQVLGVPSYLEAFSHQDTKAAVFIDGPQNLEHQDRTFLSHIFPKPWVASNKNVHNF